LREKIKREREENMVREREKEEKKMVRAGASVRCFSF